jgi:hypothetical protein
MLLWTKPPQADVHFLAMHKALTLLQSNVYYSGKCKDRADTRNWYYSVLGQERWPRLVMCQQGALICIFAGSEWNRPGQDGKQAKLGTTPVRRQTVGGFHCLYPNINTPESTYQCHITISQVLLSMGAIDTTTFRNKKFAALNMQDSSLRHSIVFLQA